MKKQIDHKPYPDGTRKWEGHAALRVGDAHMGPMRKCIGESLPVWQREIEAEDTIRL